MLYGPPESVFGVIPLDCELAGTVVESGLFVMKYRSVRHHKKGVAKVGRDIDLFSISAGKTERLPSPELWRVWFIIDHDDIDGAVEA